MPNRARTQRLLPRLYVGLSVVAMLLARPSGEARAFTHVVRKGETLASIAKRIYGRADLEHVLVGANALDAQGGSAIAPGMRLEVPTLGHQRTALGDTWAELADRFLGDPKHSRVLSESNGSHPWLPPDPGSEIVIPYVLRHYAAADETIFDLSQRYLGDKMLAWQLVIFNDLKGNDIRRGDVVLIPLKELPLSPEGETEAATAATIDAWKQGGHVRARQKYIDEKLPELTQLVSSGRWLEAIALGNRLLGFAHGPHFEGPTEATRSQVARLGKLLATAYVALDATGSAIDACQLYLDNANVVHLEPETTSPKVRQVCARLK
jgi:hypothetical protein